MKIRNNLLLMLAMILAIRCTQKDLYEKEPNGQIKITSHTTAINSLEIVPWKVGPGKKQSISKGIRFGIKLPLLASEELMELVEKNRIDSWIIQIKRGSSNTASVLSTLTIPFVSSRKDSTQIHQISSISIYLYYAAAAIAKRFEHLICPIMDHQKEIGSLILLDSKGPPPILRVSEAENSKINDKITTIGFAQIILNGGTELTGNFTVDLALFNSKDRIKKSNFITIPGTIEIKNELITPISGCADFVLPDKQKNEDKIKQFNFGTKDY